MRSITASVRNVWYTAAYYFPTNLFFFYFFFFFVWVLLWVNVIQKKTGDCCTCKKHCNAVVGCCDDAPLHEFRPQYRRSDEQRLVRNIRAWHASSQMSSKRSRTRGACSHARYVLQSEHKSAFFFFSRNVLECLSGSRVQWKGARLW